MSWARRVDIECTRPVWWQRKKRFQPWSCFCVRRPLLSGRSLKLSCVLSANSSAVGGGGGGGPFRFFLTTTFGTVVTDGMVVAGCVVVVDGVDGAPCGGGSGVGGIGACACATVLTH